MLDLRSLQGLTRADERAGIEEGGGLVTPERDVEAARAVHPPEAVEAGLVEIDEPRRPLGGGKLHGVERADALEMRALVDVQRQRVEDAAHLVAHLLIGVDELAVGVGEKGAARPQREEERAAADERLVIAAQPPGNVLVQFGEERRLAAGPLHEGARLARLLPIDCRIQCVGGHGASR